MWFRYNFFAIKLLGEGGVVRSLSGKNWQDRYKADKFSISFPATPNDKLNVFGDVMKIFEKFIIPGGEKLLF